MPSMFAKLVIGALVFGVGITALNKAFPPPGVDVTGYSWRPDGGVTVVDDAKAMAYAAKLGKEMGGPKWLAGDMLDGNGGMDNWRAWAYVSALGQPTYYDGKDPGLQHTPVDSIPFVYRLFRALIQGAVTSGLTTGMAKSLIIALRKDALTRGVPLAQLPDLDLGGGS